MSDKPPKTERKLDRGGDKQTLRGVVGDDVDDLDIYGYEVIYTTGEFTIGREDLLEKADDVGIPEWMLPSKTKAHRAFGYAIKDLLDDREEFEVEGQRVRYLIDDNDSRYSWSVDARVYYPPELTGDDDGKWQEQSLGVIKYENPDNGEPRVRFIDRIDADKKLAPRWGIGKVDGETVADGLANYDNREAALTEGSLRARMEALFEKHKESHRGKDVNNMVWYLVGIWTDSLKLRDACYFVPANHTYRIDGEELPVVELIDAFAELYDWLDVHAEKPTFAQHTEINVVEIMDTDRQRQMVERKVGDRLEDMADTMAEDVIDHVQDDDTVVSEVVSEVTEALDNLRVMAGEYDDLLDTEKANLKTERAVKRAVNAALADLDDGQADLVAEVLEETDVEVGDA